MARLRWLLPQSLESYEAPRRLQLLLLLPTVASLAWDCMWHSTGEGHCMEVADPVCRATAHGAALCGNTFLSLSYGTRRTPMLCQNCCKQQAWRCWQQSGFEVWRETSTTCEYTSSGRHGGGCIISVQNVHNKMSLLHGYTVGRMWTRQFNVGTRGLKK